MVLFSRYCYFPLYTLVGVTWFKCPCAAVIVGQWYHSLPRGYDGDKVLSIFRLTNSTYMVNDISHYLSPWEYLNTVAVAYDLRVKGDRYKLLGDIVLEYNRIRVWNTECSGVVCSAFRSLYIGESPYSWYMVAYSCYRFAYIDGPYALLSNSNVMCYTCQSLLALYTIQHLDWMSRVKVTVSFSWCFHSIVLYSRAQNPGFCEIAISRYQCMLCLLIDIPSVWDVPHAYTIFSNRLIQESEHIYWEPPSLVSNWCLTRTCLASMWYWRILLLKQMLWKKVSLLTEHCSSME